MPPAYSYDPRVIEQLGQHGLVPRETTAPQQLRDALRDLYRYEIRRLRSELLAGRIPRPSYADHVIALRRRYWLLSVPVELWVQAGPPAGGHSERDLS